MGRSLSRNTESPCFGLELEGVKFIEDRLLPITCYREDISLLQHHLSGWILVRNNTFWILHIYWCSTNHLSSMPSWKTEVAWCDCVGVLRGELGHWVHEWWFGQAVAHHFLVLKLLGIPQLLRLLHEIAGWADLRGLYALATRARGNWLLLR